MKQETSRFWKDKRVLVTGAGGFIGSHLVERLVQKGAQVHAFIRHTSRADVGLLGYLKAALGDEVEIIAGDLRDPHAVEAAVAGMDVVFHLGAIISIPYSYVHPWETAQTNLMGTLAILLACRAHVTPRLVHASTSEVYGSALRMPMDESHPLQGQSPYAASKIGADKLVESFYRSYGLPVVTVRPFNTYGPRQSGRAVIPTIISQALTRDEVHLGNLETRRDFTFIADTVAGFLAAGRAPERALGQEINLGAGKDIAIGDLAQEIFRQIDRPLAIVTDDERLRPEGSEVMHLRSDNTLAQELLGWKPQYLLAKGLAETISWIREHLDHYRIGQYES